MFNTGRVVATPAALDLLEEAKVEPSALLSRHVSRDWGDVCDEDWRQNNWSVDNEQMLLSSYPVGGGDKVWVITEWDRSATTILLPSEY
jgi:hypothetical protein|tara:strand:- start:1248 stop:1514 length:267 start_codon:yes stop_codon:yes gene_type:complete